MRIFTKNETLTPIDGQIASVLNEMNEMGVDSEDYPKLLTYLERLNELKVKERREPVSRDTVASVVGNLMGILLIVAYEQKHVMTSKAFSHLIRVKEPK